MSPSESESLHRQSMVEEANRILASQEEASRKAAGQTEPEETLDQTETVLETQQLEPQPIPGQSANQTSANPNQPHEPQETLDYSQGARWLKQSEISAQAYTVIDLDSGQELLAESSDLPLSMAGFVRLMTLNVVLNDPNFDPAKPIIISGQDPLDQYFLDGEEISTEAGIFAMMYADSASAALALAETYGPGQEAFVAKMNQAAADLELANISFVDPSGRSASTLASAADLARIYQELFKLDSFKQVYKYQAYLLPQSSRHELAGLVKIENPAKQIDLMNSIYLKELKGLTQTQNQDNWAYGAAQAVTTNGRNLLAVVLGAGSKRDELEGSDRAAQVLRVLLEEAAINAGASPDRDSLSILSQKFEKETEVNLVETQVTEASTQHLLAETSMTPTQLETGQVAVVSAKIKGIGLQMLIAILVGLLVLVVVIVLLIRRITQRKRMVQKSKPDQVGAARPIRHDQVKQQLRSQPSMQHARVVENKPRAKGQAKAGSGRQTAKPGVRRPVPRPQPEPEDLE